MHDKCTRAQAADKSATARTSSHSTAKPHFPSSIIANMLINCTMKISTGFTLIL